MKMKMMRTMAKKVRTTMTAIIKTNSDEDPAKIRLFINIEHISETIMMLVMMIMMRMQMMTTVTHSDDDQDAMESQVRQSRSRECF